MKNIKFNPWNLKYFRICLVEKFVCQKFPQEGSLTPFESWIRLLYAITILPTFWRIAFWNWTIERIVFWFKNKKTTRLTRYHKYQFSVSIHSTLSVPNFKLKKIYTCRIFLGSDSIEEETIWRLIHSLTKQFRNKSP